MFDTYPASKCTTQNMYTRVCAGLVVIVSLRTALGSKILPMRGIIFGYLSQQKWVRMCFASFVAHHYHTPIASLQDRGFFPV